MIKSPEANSAAAADPIFTLVDSNNITLTSMHITAHDNAAGVLLDEGDSPCEIVVLEKLHLQASKRSAAEILAGDRITIIDCTIEMANQSTEWPAVFAVAEGLLIERNRITMSVDQADPADAATGALGRGGIQLGGLCKQVRVHRNLIKGGNGDGITLGSIVQVNTVTGGTELVVSWESNPVDPCDPCAPGTTDVPTTEGPNDELRNESAGPLIEVHISDNRICHMGRFGIGVAGYFDLEESDEMITVQGLEICHNRIRGCLQRPIEDIPKEKIDGKGFGGISLADAEYLTIHDNHIENNGLSHLDPVCGVFVLHGEGIDISRNLIRNNGPRTDESDQGARLGRRGGINIVYALAPITALAFGDDSLARQNGVPAVKIHGNIVSQELGQALSVKALGPVSVVGNQFTSRGVVLSFESPSLYFATVVIFNLGVSNELYFQPLFYSGERVDPGLADMPKVEDDFVFLPRPGLDDAKVGAYLANGNVLFCDNQCVLDLLANPFGIAVSSVAVATLDDVGFHSNQCDCSLVLDYVLTNILLFGFSCRMSDNRLKEGLLNANLSGFTFGLFMNTATDNQSTHCLQVLALVPPSAAHQGRNIVNRDNLITSETLGILWPTVFESLQNNCRQFRENTEIDNYKQ